MESGETPVCRRRDLPAPTPLSFLDFLDSCGHSTQLYTSFHQVVMTLPQLWLIVAGSCLPVFTATQHKPQSLLFCFHWLLTVDSRVILSPYSVVIPFPQAFCIHHSRVC